MPRAVVIFRVLAPFCVGAYGLAAGPSMGAMPSPRPPRQIAVFRPSTREWVVRSADGSESKTQFGDPGDQPVPADYLGTGETQIAVFRPSMPTWLLLHPDGSMTTTPFGEAADIPVPADYLGLGHAQIAVFRPSTGDWVIRRDDGTTVDVPWGTSGDLPVPADYVGQGHAQIAVFRPSTGQWLVRTDSGMTTTQLGEPGDVPVPADYLGMGHAQFAVFRPATSEWILRGSPGQTAPIPFGTKGDLPFPGDYQGLGTTLIAVFRPSDGEWQLRASDGTTSVTQWGEPGDVPVLLTRREPSYTVYGERYATSYPRETLTAPFTRPDGGVTVNGYHGFILLRVTGVGQSDGGTDNDAFYLYTSPFKPPRNGYNGGYYQLAFSTSELLPYDWNDDAENYLVGSLPAYHPDHDYTFILDTTLDYTATGFAGFLLHFGVSDGIFSDNTGAYTIRVTQLVLSP
jgi:putative transposon-encoded protein